MVADSDYPAVSVIIYSAGDPVKLDRLITDVFAQDYPADMEVIVVNDGKIAEIKDVVTRQQVRHRNLYVTFTPLEARNLSRRKLALTLGIKAARHEVVVLTDDCCLPASDWWLRLMTYPFANPATEMVVGHGFVEGDNGFGGGCRRFTIGADAVEYLSAVQSGHPYRATGHNLAYRRDLFFNNKGFSRSLNLHDGDDDIFVNEVARGSNTVLSVAKAAHMSVSFPDARRAYCQEKTRRAFTASFLRRGTRMWFGFCSLMMWVWLALAVTACVMSWPNMLVPACELAVGLLLWTVLSLTWRRTLKSLSYAVSGWTLPLLLMMRPFVTLRFKLRARWHKSDHFTWKS